MLCKLQGGSSSYSTVSDYYAGLGEKCKVSVRFSEKAIGFL